MTSPFRFSGDKPYDQKVTVLFRGRLKVGHEILGKTEHLYRNVYLHESEFGETLTDNADGNTELN